MKPIIIRNKHFRPGEGLRFISFLEIYDDFTSRNNQFKEHLPLNSSILDILPPYKNKPQGVSLSPCLNFDIKKEDSGIKSDT